MRPISFTLAVLMVAEAASAQINGVSQNTIKIIGLERPDHRCSSSRPSVLILDDAHLLVSKSLNCAHSGGTNDWQVAVTDLDGKLLVSTNSAWDVSLGPNGQLIAEHDGSMDILNLQLLSVAQLTPPFPHEYNIFLSPSRDAFSSCSNRPFLVTPYSCTFFAGNPPAVKAEFQATGSFPGLTTSGFARLPAGSSAQPN